MRAARRHAVQKYRATQPRPALSSRPALTRSIGSPDPLHSSLPRNGDVFYTEAQQRSASLWLWIYFWLMMAFFVFCLASALVVMAGRGTWGEALKPAGWSLLFSVFVFFRWLKLSQIEAGLLRQAAQRAQLLRHLADAKEQEYIAAEVDAVQIKYERSALGPRLQSAESNLQSIMPVMPKPAVPANALLSASAPPPWKSKTQRDDEWLDQEARWRLDAKHGKNANEEARQREARHSEPPNMPEISAEEQKSLDIERQVQALERQIRQR